MSSLGSFRIINQLGEGSFATVFLGEEKDSKERYAIKVITNKNTLPEKLFANIEQEVLFTSSFRHPNLVQLHRYFIAENGSPCLVLDYCPGGDLRAFLKNNGKLSERQALHFFGQIVDGVAYLHSMSCMHRDLKPANILLCEHPTQIKLADFGLTRYLPDQDLASTYCGSPLYMAPEVFNGDPYGKEVDLWSLGCIFYEMIIGQYPFPASNIVQLFEAIQKLRLIKPVGMQSSDTSWEIIEKASISIFTITLPIEQLQTMLKIEPLYLTDCEDCQCSSSQSPSSIVPPLIPAVDSVSSEEDDMRQRSFSLSDDGFEMVEALDAGATTIRDIVDETEEWDLNYLRSLEPCLAIVNAIINVADQFVCRESTCEAFFRTQSGLELRYMSNCVAYDAMKTCGNALALYLCSLELLKCHPLSPSSWRTLPSRDREYLKEIYASIVKRCGKCHYIINFLLHHRNSYAISFYEVPPAEKVILAVARYKKTAGYAHLDKGELRLARYEFCFALRLLQGLSMLSATELPISSIMRCDLEVALLKLAQLPNED
eukprot:scaffold1869_cov163-Ochromonas_danica.AAC.18